MGEAKVIPMNGRASIDKALTKSEQRPAAAGQTQERPAGRIWMECVERPIQPHWLIQVKDERGRTVWYVRMEVTGLFPRRYGPFPSKKDALYFLNEQLDAFLDQLDCAFSRKNMIPGGSPTGLIVEDELAVTYLQQRQTPEQSKPKKGR